MKVNSLIELLQGISEQHGNLNVKVGVAPDAPTVTGVWVPMDPDATRYIALSHGEGYIS